MASTYPGALDSIAANKANATVAIDDHAPHHNDLTDAINAVQTALGVNLGNVEAGGAVAAHVAAADPHTQYATAAEVNSAADARIAASNKVSSDPTSVTGADAITDIVALFA